MAVNDTRSDKPFSKKFTIILLLFFVFLLINNACWGQNGKQDSTSLEIIAKIFASAEAHAKGVDLLKNAISQNLIQWNATNKDTICYILKWYDRSGDPFEFEQIIYGLLDYNTMQSIEECFRVTNKLGNHVENAKRKWLTPNKITISPDSFSIMVNDSKPMDVTVKNVRGYILNSKDYALKCEISNKELGKFFTGEKKFIAGNKNGKLHLNIFVKDYDNISHSVSINVYGESTPPPPPPHPAPIISKIEPLRLLPGGDFTITGENFCSTIDSNDIYIGESIKLRPAKVSPTQIKLNLPEFIPAGEYPVSIVTEFGKNMFDDPISIMMPKPCPSQKWPRISTGAFLLAGTVYIVSSISATNKWNDYADDPDHSQELYDDYKDVHKIKQISGIATLATGVSSAVLWYFYIKDKKKCNSSDNELAFVPDSRLNGIRLVYSF